VASEAELDALVAVAPMNHSSLIWATLYGWLLFGVLPTSATWVGRPIIVANGLCIAWRQHSLHRDREATIEMLR
jgi:drug/metabolite transporter (DMT)-like permease